MMILLHTDDAFATMLLMSQISADREEIVRPFSTAEYYRLTDAIRMKDLSGPGHLLGMDLGAVKRLLDITEQEAYRLCVLLGRVMPLSYALERFLDSGIDIVTVDEPNYPARLIERLGDKAPPMLYACGDLRLANKSCIALIGVSGKPGAEECVHALSEKAAESHLTVVTGGEVGVGRLAELEIARAGGEAISFLAESLSERIYQPNISEMIAGGRALALSQVHPDAKYTVSHALERNKCLYALSHAAFVVSCEAEKGTAWEGAASALRNKWCKRVYAWKNESIPGNMRLIERGAAEFADPASLPLAHLARTWHTPKYEQLSMF